MIYSHSYEDPDTGDVIDVMVDEDDDGADEYRNARPRARQGRGFAGFCEFGQAATAIRSPARRQPPARAAPAQSLADDDRSRTERRNGASAPAQEQGMVQDTGEYVAVKKSAIAEIVPALGQIWASFLVPPEPPKAIGNDIVDRDNATMHRQALAQHDQNQTRILALTNLAARAAKLFL